MPPFRAGLQKRKLNAEEAKGKPVKDESSDSGEGEDLLVGGLDNGEDATDSENEAEAANSDTEPDGVMFGDDADSTLGDDDEDDEDEDDVEEATDESSELTDSEADDESEDADDDDDDKSDDEESAASDSGEESGLGHTHGSSDEESEKNTPNIAKKQNKTKTKPDSSKETKIKEITSSSKEFGPKEKEKVEVKSKKDKKGKGKSVTTIAIRDKSSNAVDKLQKQIEDSHIIEGKDEYESGDSSDEEDRRNTVGDIPMWWYNEYQHIGYDLDGKKIIKPPQRDQIDEFLKKCEDPDFWRTVRDPQTGQDVVLSAADLELLARIKNGMVPNADHDEYEPWVDWFSREVLATPVRAFPEHKRSFLPSRSDQRQVSKLVHALKMGWIKTRKQLADERKKKKEKQFYNLWGSSSSEEEQRLRGIHKHIAAPRRALPGHAESYNPPPEYLLDSKELKEWNKLKETPWKRKYTFLPTQYKALRQVPAYERFIRERFLRCLDLYLAPRAIKMRLTISPEDLVPKLPSPRDLQPFPTKEVLQFKGHANIVRSCDFDPSGQYVVSSSEDGTVKVWEASTGRCLRTIDLGEPVVKVEWTPAKGLSLIAAAVGNRLLLLNPGSDIGAHKVAAATDELLEEPPPQHDTVMDERTQTAIQWEKVTPEEWAKGIRIAIKHFKPVTHLSWHARGDYIAATLADGDSRAVVAHQLSRRRSQLPLSRARGRVQATVWHPVRPCLLVATQRVVRIYDLVKQELVKKLLTGAQWISTLAVHPAGDNLIVCSYDRKCIWFDLDLSSKPYQTLRLHGGAVRAVAFHKRYPLFATAGDDKYIVVSHGMVYNDLLQNPLLVPLKQLPAPAVRDSLCVLDLRFHPTQPWLLVAGADTTMRLYA
ncbi:ribosome biogenesis protein BOP1 homolog [Plutella xylostella]|uniref:ribosome biogenesis protein BOP1 homolog n=1 Tax=Plutella xylostella TaxID=51655 RepID=UPI0020328DD4|nr:ribosome biogenesis protein BOP1 homolog [Plutella xylostella]